MSHSDYFNEFEYESIVKHYPDPDTLYFRLEKLSRRKGIRFHRLIRRIVNICIQSDSIQEVEADIERIDLSHDDLPESTGSHEIKVAHLSDDMYQNWRKRPTKQNMSAVVVALEGLVWSELPKYRGSVGETALKANAKKVVVGAIKRYNPNMGVKLSTFVVNDMKQLHRLNYESSRAVRMSEELQQGIPTYREAYDDLSNRFRREPSYAELSDRLKWPKSKVQRIERQMVGEVFSTQMEVDPTHTEGSPIDHKIDYLYNDLGPKDKVILERTIGYRGIPRWSKKQIAKKLKMTPARVTQRAESIAKHVKGML